MRHIIIKLSKDNDKNFPGGLVVKTPSSQHRGHWFDPWSPGRGTKIPHATWHRQKKKKKKKKTMIKRES